MLNKDNLKIIKDQLKKDPEKFRADIRKDPKIAHLANLSSELLPMRIANYYMAFDLSRNGFPVAADFIIKNYVV